MSQLPPEPPRPRTVVSRLLARVVIGVLALEAVVAVVYGVFALGPRRGIFADLAAAPDEVTREAATRSDDLNLVLFLVAAVVTVAAAVLTGVLLVKLRQVGGGFALPWWLLTGAAFAAIAVALGLHVSTDPGQIVVGYVILGGGALLVAVSAIWAAVQVRQTTRESVTVEL
ncbi:hypothetical protein [Thermasporomyces composti]|uniref:Uncharacterized protein n=1 Tax=Thermasporomyces composti TaxID=696763 RepID=A0A3D9VGX1_THECX|nr:hypothetical protein [Thermasporomyces composti]REF36561.1 hypothetical protein DFJ64_1974 [Thermasporomyces composti]